MITAILDTEAALQALAPEWDALWRRTGSPPFQSTAWLLPWWGAFGTGQPRVATLRVGGALVGLLPLYGLDEGAERKLLPLGVGLTDYCDALIDPAAPPDAAALLLQAALARARDDGVTSCTLPELPPGAALLDAAAPGWREVALADTPCPVLTLAHGIPPGMLRNVRQSRHRAERVGGWQAEAATAAEAPGLWQALVGLHRARWTALGESGVLADPAVLAFHDAAVPRLAAAGLLRMQVLRVGGQVAALYHTLAAPGRLLFYISAFDAAHAFASPGTLLLGHIVEQAAADGVAELHFLRGGEGYKYAWGAVDRMNRSRLLLPG